MADLDLDALHAEHGSWADVATALRELAENEEERAGALRALANVQREHLENPAAAAETLETLAELGDEDAALLAELAELYGAAEEYESQTAVLLDAATATADASERGAILRSAVLIYAEKLEQEEATELVLQKALMEDPSAEEGWNLAVTVAHKFGRLTEGAEILTAHANHLTETSGDESAFGVLLLIADLYLAAKSPDLAEAFLSRAALLDETDVRVKTALAGVQREAEDWEALVETLGGMADAADGSEDELELRRELGLLRFDKLADPEGAIREYQRAADLGGEDDDVAALHALYDATGRTEELSQLLRSQAAAAEGDAKLDILVQIAALQAGPLEDLDAASATYREVIEADPSRSAAWTALGSLLEQREAWSELRDHLANWANHADDDLLVILGRQASVEETKLADANAATETYEMIRELDDSAEGVLPALIRLYGAAERWTDAIPVHLRLAEFAADTNGWAAELVHAANHYRTLGQAEEAAATFSLVLQHVPDHAETLAALEELQTEAGDVEGAIESLRQRIELATEGEEREALQLRKAALELPAAPGLAAGTLNDLLAANADHAEARAMLGTALEAAADWPKFTDWLMDASEREFDPSERAALLARVGVLLETELDNLQGAHESYRQAIELDPTNQIAATPLAQAYLEEEDWARARPLLEELKKGAEPGTDEWLMFSLNLGATYEFLELAEEAIANYEATLEHAPDRLATLSSLGRLHMAAGNAARANECYGKILESADELSETDQLELYFRGGEAAAAAGLTETATERFRSALAIDELHEASLKAIAALEAEDADPQARLEAKETLLQITEDPTVRFKLLIEIGDAYRDLDASAGALEAYSMALELEKDSKVALHRLLTIYSETELWQPASQVLMRLAKLEESEPKKVKLLFTIGAIYRDQLEDPGSAANVFDNLLDEDPTRQEAFDALEELHTEREDWPALEKSYRRHLARILGVEGQDDVRFTVATKLAALYRDALDRPDDAIASFKVASGMRPDNADVLEAITAIYPKNGKTDGATIAEHRALVALRPEREDSYHLLFGAFERERRFDEAWTTASILAVLGNREKKPTEFYTGLRPSSVPLARRGLTRAEWRMLQHPDLSVEATRLLSVIAATMRRVYSHQLKDWGINRKKDAIDITAPSPVTNLYHYSAQVLGVAMPSIYNWASGSGFQNANTEPRSVLVGPDILASSADRSVVFRIARTMCLMRNEFYLAAALSKTALVPLVQACISLFTGGPPDAWKNETVEGWMRGIRAEPDELLQTLGEAVAEYVNTGEPLNLNAWPAAVELTAHRVALLICGDMPRAAKGANDVVRPIGDVGVRERVIDMVRFASTADYAALRGELGLGIGQQ